MCRLGKIIMDLKRVRLTNMGLAEKQHTQLPGLDIRVPSLHASQGAEWVKRCSSGQSLAQDQELSDSGISEEDRDSFPCKIEALSGAAHTTNRALEGDAPAPVMPGLRADNPCALGAVKFDPAHFSSFGAGTLNTAGAVSETLDSRGNTTYVGEKGAMERVSERNSSAVSACNDGSVDHDFSNSGKLAIVDDYLTELWDDDLEDAILRCSDESSLKSKIGDTGMVNRNFEPAMPDLTCELTHMAKCRDNTDGTASICCNAINACGVSKSVSSDMRLESSMNASGFFCPRQEDLVTHYNVLDDDLSGDGLLSPSDNMPLKFSQQQMDVLEAVACGKSVFITGSAGTGKSFLLMYIIRMLKNAVGEESVYVTASTGLAACALRGTTLHWFAGIGLGTSEQEHLVGKVLRNKESTNRWNSAQVLVIDEISMIDGELFDKLDYVARAVRKTASCFGGIQLIVTGDFFQLPPVNPPNRCKFFAFQADCWNNCFDLQLELEHVFRQSDSTFIRMLNEIRKGAPTAETLTKLSLCQRVLPDDGTEIAPTRLYPLKVDVRLENMQELKALQTDIITFLAVDSASKPLHRYMFDGMKTQKELQLCVGAQVMLTKNLDTGSGLVNGAKGVVVGFQSSRALNEKDEDHKQVKAVAHIVSPSGLWPVVRFSCGIRVIGPKKESAEDGGVEVVSRIQVPLILAWALSVHKCQGMTLDKVQTDLSKAFDFGMVYVALSRVKDLDGLQLMGFDPTRIKVHPDVLTFFDKLVERV